MRLFACGERKEWRSMDMYVAANLRKYRMLLLAILKLSELDSLQL